MTLRPALPPGLASELFAPERALTLLRAAWPLAVGARLAERTRPIGLEGAMLLVRVPDERWRKILHRLRREILARLSELAGPRAPRALGFVESREGAPAGERPGAPPPLPSPAPLPQSVAAAAEQILDAELRAGFLAAAGRYLARAR